MNHCVVSARYERGHRRAEAIEPGKAQREERQVTRGAANRVFELAAAVAPRSGSEDRGRPVARGSQREGSRTSIAASAHVPHVMSHCHCGQGLFDQACEMKRIPCGLRVRAHEPNIASRV